MIRIIQHSTNGIGHQLYGLFSCMLLHGIKNYYFDGSAFVDKEFNFAHLDEKQSADVKQYMIEIVSLFNKHFNIVPQPYTAVVNCHEQKYIPMKADTNVVYSLDNAYYFDKLSMTAQEKLQHAENIAVVKNFFINKYLPANRLAKNNIVFHFRLSDALTTDRSESIKTYNTAILKLISYLSRQYKDHTCYLHTNGSEENIQFVLDKLKQSNMKYEVCDKSTQILSVVSDFIYARVLVCGNSGLSKVCSFLGTPKLVITNDDNKHSMPANSVKISSLTTTKYGKTPYVYA